MEVEIYDLGGNTTALVTNRLGDEEALIVAGKIMKNYPEVEQVGMILDANQGFCTFRMMGGEFCGNACRAVAEFMRRNYGFEECEIVINGIKTKAKSNGRESEVVIPRDELVRRVESSGEQFIVYMNGITHIVIPQDFDDTEKVAEQIKQDYEERNKITDALGVNFLVGNKINPFVWVTKAKTFFNETACLGGSIAAAMLLNPSGKSIITQPSGENYEITIDGKNIVARGRVSFVGDFVV